MRMLGRIRLHYCLSRIRLHYCLSSVPRAFNDDCRQHSLMTRPCCGILGTRLAQGLKKCSMWFLGGFMLVRDKNLQREMVLSQKKYCRTLI